MKKRLREAALLVVCLVLTLLWNLETRKAARLEGRVALLNEQLETPPLSSCFAKDGKC